MWLFIVFIPTWYLDLAPFKRAAGRSKPQVDGGHIPFAGFILAARPTINSGLKKTQILSGADSAT